MGYGAMATVYCQVGDLGPKVKMHKLLPLVCGLWLTGCASTPVEETPRDTATIVRKPASRQSGVAGRIREATTYYTTTAQGRMVPQGSLRKGARVRVLSKAPRGWADIRLANGRVVSVESDDVASSGQYSRDLARARASRARPFYGSRNSLTSSTTGRRGISGRRGGTSRLSTLPPPADYKPPALPKARGANGKEGEEELDLGRASQLFPGG